MAKRFTDTGKWSRPWWRQLSAEAKITWQYLVDNCDHSGIWVTDYELATFQIGADITEEKFLNWFGDKVQKIDDDKIYVPSFIEFQYGELRDNNTVHISVIKSLQKHGIDILVNTGLSPLPSAVAARLSSKMKRAILSSDLFQCSYCGLHGDEKTLVVDHILARNKGGGNEDYNLTTACISCNSKKTDMDVDKFLVKNDLVGKISENVSNKIALIKKLNAPNKDLKGPKDKEEDKNKDRDEDLKKEEVEFSSKDLLDLWEKNCGELPKVREFTDERKKKASAQVKKHPDPAYWLEVIERWKASEFCLNEWKPSFDELLSPRLRTRALEGKYDNRSNKAPAQSDQTNRTRKLLDGIKKFNSFEGDELKEFLGEDLFRLACRVGISRIRSMPADNFLERNVDGMLKEAEKAAS